MNLLKELAVPLISALVIYAGKPQNLEGSGGSSAQKSLDLMSDMTKLMLPLYLPSAITGFAKSHLIAFVQEKKERFKETQKIMGMTQKAYICGWLVTSYLKMISIAVITIFSLYISGYAGEGFGFICLNFIIYLVASVHQTFAISTFFSDPKLAGEIGTFILTLTPLLYYYLTYGPQVGDGAFMLVCMLPQTAISFAITGGDSNSSKQSPTNATNNYSSKLAAGVLAADVIVYLLAYFYLDEVMPNEYGISKSPFFVFSSKFWKQLFSPSKSKKPRKAHSHYENYENCSSSEEHTLINDQAPTVIEMRKGVNFNANVSMLVSSAEGNSVSDGHLSVDIQEEADVSSAAFHQQLRNIKKLQSMVQIRNLKKHFGKVQAVNGVSLNLYQNQILCLLGHNGAGKTTTISLLTGLIEKSEGSIKIFGEELEDDLDEARQEIGLCTQRDVLYDDMTVYEHLQFIASIKGLEGKTASNEIEFIINEVGLQNEREKLAKNLSGGNKRKLSLGMALTGGSKIIFLDEPTSGMDPVSRQQIWKILEKVRDKRAIVLTTHHLDEAEKLADRIAIMSKGQLLALGTSEYIKHKFGVGYHLTVSASSPEQTFEFINQKDEITQLVKSRIPDSLLDEQSAKDALKFILPFTALPSFSQTLKLIEAIPATQINLQINSLEDAFVKIGMEDELLLQVPGRELSRDLFADIAHVPKPQALFKDPEYSFSQQFLAMFLRQFYMTTRNWSAILMIMLPVAFNLLGVYVAKHFLDRLEDVLKLGAHSSAATMFPIKMYFLQIFIVQAYSMNSSIYINTPVLEREYQLKYALNVMGCRPLPYWLGTLAFDYIVYFCTFMLFYLSVDTINVEFLVPYLSALLNIMLCFGFSLITFCYLSGFLFNSSNSAFKSFPIITFFVSYSIPWLILQLTRSKTYLTINIFCQYIFLATSPFLTLEKALENINLDDNETETNSKPIGDQDIRGHQVFNTWQAYSRVLIIQAIFFFLVTLLIEKLSFSLKNRKSAKIITPPIAGQLDEGVKREIERVNSPGNFDPIKVKQIHKIYPNGYHAVKGTTFSVEKGQIFGLLGPNGAGKSTTFNIITANIPKTAGQVKLNGQEIADNPSTFFTDIGVCPQQDCLWEYLIPEEHLKLFGRVKGLKGKDLLDMVDYYLRAMQLESFPAKSANLSGGNKRKLCVANSLIASPSLQFFDEPSTGLDPIAKRYLWRCLKDNLIAKDSSIVLTTHSLQEAEDLCHKIAIQINGEFVCLDSLQNLKNQKGDGYKISIKLFNQKANHNEIKKIISEAYPEAKILNENDKNYANCMIYQIPFKGFLFSAAFTLLYDNLKQQSIIEDFSISQASLEDIFIYYSQFQIQLPQDTPSTSSPSTPAVSI